MAVSALLLAVGFGLGWFVTGRSHQAAASRPRGTTLRLSGYELISPLLLCDTTFTGSSPSLRALETKLSQAVESGKRTGAYTQASVYFRDLVSGREVGINPEERFFPASLKKLPLMMEYYRESETDPSLLTTKRPLLGSSDENAGAALPPSQAPRYGDSYTAQELIDYMIKYSDNISYGALFAARGEDRLDTIYRQMRLDYPASAETPESVGDYATPYQFSLFFRTLYNASYLSEANSERALRLLSQADYKEGIVAGVPEGTTVAHKFGISSVTQPDGKPQGELHDCGIVYAGERPYLLCVMTKSVAPLEQAQSGIAAISEIAYKAAQSEYRE